MGETTHFMGVAASFFFCYLFYFLFWETVNLNLTFSAFAVNVILNLSNLPFCVEVAKLRAKSLFLSIILLEVLFVSAWSKANKKYSFCGPENICSHPIEAHWTFWMGSGGAGGGVKDQNFKRKKYEPKLEFSDEGGKICGKPFKCQSSMFAGTLPLNRFQVYSSPWAIYWWVQPELFPSLRGTLGKRSSLTSPNNRKLEKKSQNTADPSAITNKLNVQKQVTTFKFWRHV